MSTIKVPIPMGYVDGSLGPLPPEEMIGFDPRDQAAPASAATLLDAPIADGTGTSPPSTATDGDGIAAAAAGDVPALRAHLDAGWNPRSVDKNGCNALHWAAGAGHKAAAELLVAQGVCPHQANRSGRTALHWAARNGRRDLLWPRRLEQRHDDVRVVAVRGDLDERVALIDHD